MTEEFNIIYNKALELLSRREHSKEEINQKLLIRFPSESVNIKLVIEKLSKTFFDNWLELFHNLAFTTLLNISKFLGCP